MLAKTTISAGILLAGLLTTASAQTYEPNGNFQALWNAPSGARPAAAPAPRAALATATVPQSYQPNGNFQALWTAPTAAAAPRAGRAASQAYAKQSSNPARPQPRN